MRIKITPREIPEMIRLTHQMTGIYLDEQKAYLFEGRLTPVLKDFNLNSYQEISQKIKTNRSLKEAFINAIVTDETSFFRDQRPYELLAHKLVPEIIEKQSYTSKPEIRIWSAACSKGQEPYSIAMILKEILFKLENYRISILATDISSKSLDYASNGVYSKFEMSRGMTLKRLQQHFIQEGSSYRVKPELRSLITFKRLNLLETLPFIGTFNLVFCRNVLVYFNLNDRKVVYDKIADRLSLNGFLVIGATEHLPTESQNFEAREFQSKVYYEKVK
jgi:chemotaxis protein methyltransferase CheR